jgi:hypothetical protein
MSKNDLIRICTEIREQYCDKFNYPKEWDLERCCIGASEFLYEGLLKRGIQSYICEGECFGCNHFWVEYEDYILDLTIKQFEKFEKIVLPYIFVEKKLKCFMYKLSDKFQLNDVYLF